MSRAARLAGPGRPARRSGRGGGGEHGGRSGHGAGHGTERGGADGEPDVATVLDLLAAACAAGAGIPGALVAVGAALEGGTGRGLVRAGAALQLGAVWDEVWQDRGGGGPVRDLAPVADALRASWETGVAAGPALRAAARSVRRERHARAMEAAGRLGVRLVLPLGLCYLPAFVLVGLVPVLVSMASGGLGR